ncbi:MAG TPA: leucyl aminopeptidase, partial [Polyangiaceae bacterium]|nr:leucyl aminopeptidase [Polyangiaceae bacterium]
MPLDIQFRVAPPQDLSADILVVGIPQASAKSSPISQSLKPLDRVLDGALSRLAAKEEFTGKRDQSLSLATLGRLPADKVVLLGLGERRSIGAPELRAFAAKAARTANGEKGTSLALALPSGLEGELRAVAEGLELGSYRFTKYLTGDRRPKTELLKVAIGLATRPKGNAKGAVALGQRVGVAVNLSRDWSNEPGNVMYPEAFAAAAAALAKDCGLKIQVFDFAEIRARGMKLIDAVGRGSSREPRFVHLSWTPKKATRRLVFVGKGITFDSGGLSIKPAAGMGEMKHDMSGAANVVALMAAVAAVQPRVEVHAIAACAENMPDGNAYRPGDVWGSLDGKTVEIVNTDAEGRLVLCDALALADAEHPDLIIDFATLTGAARVALGPELPALFGSDEAVVNDLARVAVAVHDPLWPMPLWMGYDDELASKIADLNNVAASGFAGAIFGALFLKRFVTETRHWLHL